MMPMEAGVYIIDSATPFLQGLADTKPEWMRKALKSVGWMMQQEIKRGIRSGAPGGKKYVEGMSTARRREIDDQKDGPKKSYRTLGKLVNAVGYQYKPTAQEVTVGWLSSSAVRLGTWQEKGVKEPVNMGMRRLFLSAGVGLTKSMIEIPARPTFDPMAEYLEPKITPYLEEKIASYVNGFSPPASTNRRKYRVRGR